MPYRSYVCIYTNLPVPDQGADDEGLRRRAKSTTFLFFNLSDKISRFRICCSFQKSPLASEVKSLILWIDIVTPLKKH